MGWSKRQFVVQAFEEIGYASYIYDIAPEQLNSALRTLDAMMASWNAIGIRIGYPLTSLPENADLDTLTDVQDSATEAIYLNLAMRLAPRVGKTLAQETKKAAKSAYDNLLVKLAQPIDQKLPTNMPSGAGNKGWRINTPFILPTVDPLLAGNDSEIEFN